MPGNPDGPAEPPNGPIVGLLIDPVPPLAPPAPPAAAAAAALLAAKPPIPIAGPPALGLGALGGPRECIDGTMGDDALPREADASVCWFAAAAEARSADIDVGSGPPADGGVDVCDPCAPAPLEPAAALRDI